MLNVTVRACSKEVMFSNKDTYSEFILIIVFNTTGMAHLKIMFRRLHRYRSTAVLYNTHVAS
jgi:hypothetical protein